MISLNNFNKFVKNNRPFRGPLIRNGESFHEDSGLVVLRTEFRQRIPHSAHVRQTDTSNRNVLRKVVIQRGGQCRILGNTESHEGFVTPLSEQNGDAAKGTAW